MRKALNDSATKPFQSRAPADQFLFEADGWSVVVIAKRLVERGFVGGQSGRCGPRRRRLPAPCIPMSEQSRLIHQDAGHMGMHCAQLVQDPEAVSIDVAPIQDFTIPKPGRITQGRKKYPPQLRYV